MGPPNALKRFKALLDSRFKILRTLDLNLESTSHLDEHALKRSGGPRLDSRFQI